MNAFITGSRKYGNPTKESDIDLVILTDFDTKRMLEELSEKSGIIRFGELNVIAFDCETEFAAWLVGTRQLQYKQHNMQKSTNKEKATKWIKKILAKMGIHQDGSYSD